MSEKEAAGCSARGWVDSSRAGALGAGEGAAVQCPVCLRRPETMGVRRRAQAWRPRPGPTSGAGLRPRG